MKNAMLIALFIILLVSNIMAFDGEREGFILGFGAGIGNTSIDKVKDYERHEDHTGLYTDFRIGVALTNQFLIHYSGKQLYGGTDSGWILFYPGVGLTYYKNPHSPSLMLMTGIGLTGGAGFDKVGRYDMDLVGSGINLYVGIGYEYAKHFMVEFNYSFSTGKIIFDPDHKTQMVSLSLHYLAY